MPIERIMVGGKEIDTLAERLPRVSEPYTEISDTRKSMREKALALAVSALCAVLVTSCAVAPTGSLPPTPQEIASADAGEYPENYEEVVRAYMTDHLKDPFSAQYRNWRGPRKARWPTPNGTLWGYGMCIDINAKNSFGAYTGWEPVGVLIRDAHVRVSDPQICKQLGY